MMVFISLFSRVLFAPLLVDMQRDLDIGAATATRFFLSISVGYTASMLASGYIAQRIMHRGTIVASGILVSLGLLWIGVSSRVPMLHLGFLFVGLGAGLYPPSGVAALVGLVTAEIRGRAIAIHETGPNMAFVVAPLVTAAGLSFFSWRFVVLSSAALAITVVVAYSRYGRGADFPGFPPNVGNLRVIVRIPAFWAILLYFTFAAASTMGIFAILPTFLIQVRGFDPTVVNPLLSVSRLVALTMVFVSGWMIDRIGIKRLIGLVVAVTSVITALLGLLHGNLLLVAVFLQPVVITAFFPAAVSAMATLGPPHLRNVTLSVAIPVVNMVASGVVPALFGSMTERGILHLGFVGTGFLMGLSLLVLNALDRTSA